MQLKMQLTKKRSRDLRNTNNIYQLELSISRWSFVVNKWKTYTKHALANT